MRPNASPGGAVRVWLLVLAAVALLSGAGIVALLVQDAPSASNPLETTTVYAVGDIAGEGDGAARLSDMLEQRNFDALLTLGDHAYEEGTAEQFQKQYAPTFGQFNDRVYPTPGNHDYVTDGAAAYYAYFDENARRFTGKEYYAFTLGSWRIYSLNSEIDEARPGDPMFEWLNHDLAESSAPCIAAYWHEPMFTVGRKENDEGGMSMVWALLAAHGADIVLAAHDHNYQRWAPINGITSFVVGTGGRSRYPIERDDERLAHAEDGTYGALRLELGPSGARYEFQSDDNETLDAGSLACRSKAAEAAPPSAPADVTATTEGDAVRIGWTASSDPSVIGYVVLRGTDVIGFTEEPTFVDDTLSADASVLYFVRAVAANGVRSSPSETVHGGGETLGYTDYTWGDADRNPSSPTIDKPQSKLWYADGSWWGILFAGDDQGGPRRAFYIHRFDPVAQGWRNTGVEVDDRDRSHADALWDEEESKLYALSVTDGGAAKLYRYSYEAGSYALDEGYPVRVTETGSESITLAKDSTGTLWATMTQLEDGSGPCAEGQPCTVRILHSLDRDYRWTESVQLPVGDTVVEPDDLSTVVAFGGDRIGVAWSNQLLGAFEVAMHADGAPDDRWTVEIVDVAPRGSDDHLNAKADASGRLYMVVKTSVNDEALGSPDAPLIVLWVRDADGTWRHATVWRTRDDVTRPQLVVDEDRGVVVVVGATPGDGGAIVMKSTPVDDLAFAEGLGTPLLAGGKMNNATTTKQTVSLDDGVLVLAADSRSRTYWHAVIRDDADDGPAPSP
ncbi:MAG TPA: metallophosphoesterase [Candidatus Limnocylindria bacterium]|nr:metallophosphoesterase [Candidatus Limnocylindria bacterium]